MSHRVLLLETIDDAALELLRAEVEVRQAASTAAEDAHGEAATGPIDAIMTRGKGRVTATLLDACRGIKAVARCGVGLDNVDVQAASERGVVVLNLPGANAQTIVEHTLMLILALSRGLLPWSERVRAGAWSQRGGYDHDEVRAKTLGVIGMGNIGSRVAELGHALGMTIVYHDPAPRESPHERADLGDVLARADIVTIHCLLDDTTRGLLDAAAIGRMKPGALLVNTARGAIVDHAALVDALQRGHLGGFAADVLETQPPADDDPLLAMPNVVLTPHVGSLTRTTYRELCVRSAQNVLAVLAGGAPQDGCVANEQQLR